MAFFFFFLKNRVTGDPHSALSISGKVDLAVNSNPKEEQGNQLQMQASKAMQVNPKHHTTKMLTGYDNILDGNYRRKRPLFSPSLTHKPLPVLSGLFYCYTPTT